MNNLENTAISLFLAGSFSREFWLATVCRFCKTHTVDEDRTYV